MSYTKIKAFCEDLYPGDWWIYTSHERESFGVQTLIGNVKDNDHSFQVFIYSDLEVNIDGYLLYQFTEEKDMSDAWVCISSDDKKAEIIFDNDNYPDKLREDLTNLIPKITEMINVISEFTEQYTEGATKLSEEDEFISEMLANYDDDDEDFLSEIYSELYGE